MKKLLSLIVIAFALVFTSCEVAKDNYKYPTKYQTVSNATEAYVTIDNLKVTNEELYFNLLAKKGASTLIKLIDKDYYAPLTEEQKVEAKKFYVDVNGQEVDEDNEDALYLNYAKYLAAVKAYIADIDFEDEDQKAEETYNTEAYKEYFENNYAKQFTVKVALFYSMTDAKTLLANAGVDAASIGSFGWTVGGADVDAAQLNTIFAALNAETYTTVTLKDFKFGTEIAAKVSEMEQGEYTLYPQAVGKYFYVAYVESLSTEYYDAHQNSLGATYTEFVEDTAKDMFFEKLATANFGTFMSAQADDNTTQYEFKNRQDNGLKIYYEGLEVAYADKYVAAFASTSGNDDYKWTEEESDTCVASFNNKNYTADDLFAELVKDSDVVAEYIATMYLINEKLDKLTAFQVSNGALVKGDDAAYSKLYKDNLKDLKSSFENNGYKSKGFQKEYGFDNFLRDLYGVTSEVNYLAYYSNVYQDALTEIANTNAKGYLVQEISEITVTYDESNSKWDLTCPKWLDTHSVTKTTANSSSVRPDTNYTVDTTALPTVSFAKDSDAIVLTFTYNYTGTDTSKAATKTVNYTTDFTKAEYFNDRASKLYDAYVAERDAKELDIDALMVKYGFAADSTERKMTADLSSFTVKYNSTYSRWDIKSTDWDDTMRDDAVHFGTDAYSYYVYSSTLSSKVESGYAIDTKVDATVSENADGKLVLTFTTYQKDSDPVVNGTLEYETSYTLSQLVDYKKSKIDSRLVGDKFSVTCTGIKVYVDADYDGVADENLTADQKTLCQAISNQVWSFVLSNYTAAQPGTYDKDGDTLSVLIDEAIRQYRLAGTGDYWNAKYNDSIVIEKVYNAAYNETSEINADFLTILKENWSIASSSVNGNTLDPLYRGTASSKVYIYTATILDTMFLEEQNAAFSMAIVKYSSVSDSKTSASFTNDAYAEKLANADSLLKAAYEAIVAKANVPTNVVEYFQSLLAK